MASRSPSTFTPFPNSLKPDTSPLGEATTTQSASSPPFSSQPVSFPPPQTFDILPPLHDLLLRLVSQQATGETSVVGNARAPLGDGAGGGNSAAAVSSAVPIPPSTTKSQLSAQPSMTPEVGGPPPLDLKDLPTETTSIKVRLQKARAVVESLPDMHRTVADQEEEIGELEDRVARLRSVIDDFGNRARKSNEKS